MLRFIDRRAEKVSKTHFWVEVEGGTRRLKLISYTPHSTLWGSEVIKYVLKVSENSYLHVGSGRTSVYNERPLLLHAASSGGYVIPGSTLKGAIAHYYTAIFRDMRTTSSLFGWAGYMSRALFSDAYTKNKPTLLGIGPSWIPRIGERGIKVYKSDIQLEHVDKPHQYVEAFPKGTEFEGRIVILNPMKSETARLLIAMGVKPKIAVPFLLGFGKPKGMGKVVLDLESLKILRLDQRGSGEDITKKILEDLTNIYNEIKSRFEEVLGVG